MISAELKSLHSPDVDLASFSPSEPDEFGILIQALIGLKGQDGEESFGILVCTPQWFAKEQLSRSSYIWGRTYLFVNTYDISCIQSAIEDLCHRFKRDTWEELANEISRYSHWEFEDYHENI